MTAVPPHLQRLFTPSTPMRELTARSVMMGCLLGSMVAGINVYFGLQTSWNITGSLVSAILGYTLFNLWKLHSPYSLLENNITQTTGSAAGSVSMAIGAVNYLPALKMAGVTLTIGQIYFWAFAVSFIGIFIAIPIRKQLILREGLRFPTARAAAETILVMHHHQDTRAKQKARVLIIMGIFAATYTLLAFFFPVLKHPHLIEAIGLPIIAHWGFSLLGSPMLIGGGILMGIRVTSSMLLGAIAAWGIIGPLIQAAGYTTSTIMDYSHGVVSWLVWPGIALMLSESLTQLLLSIPHLIKSWCKSTDPLHEKFDENTKPFIIGFKPWLAGLTFVSIVSCIILQTVLNIHYTHTLLALALTSPLAMIAARATGETDINPISTMGKVTQLSFGYAAPGQLPLNILCAGITSASATQCGDMMQDLKTGFLLSANPASQFIAQLFGIVAGIIFAVPVYLLFDHAYKIGGAAMPAPAAHSWYGMGLVLTKGVSTLPLHVVPAMLTAAYIGVLLPILRRFKRLNRFVPSGIAVGIGFFIPAFYSICIFLGGLTIWIWNNRFPLNARDYGYPFAAGLIVGEGLMGIIVAILILLGVKPLFA